MKSSYPEWYWPSDDECRELWETALVVLDSNVLLGLYQYPQSSLNEFLAVLEAVRDRLWLPYHAGLEFHKLRFTRKPEQRLVLVRLEESVQKVSHGLDAIGEPDFHPTLRFDELRSRRADTREAIEKLVGVVRDALNELPDEGHDPSAEDPILNRVTQLFNGRVGTPMTDDELAALRVEGEARYEKEVPPGFKDRGKDEASRYGDLIIWREILKRARATPDRAAMPVIFATNDRKDDWWRRHQDALHGPRTELIREFINHVGQPFWMYTPSDFLKAARNYLGLSVSTTTLDQVRSISDSPRAIRALRSQGMSLPTFGARTAILERIFDAYAQGNLQIVDDLNETIRSVGRVLPPDVAGPLFFSLINESYGLIKVSSDPAVRLRERQIEAARHDESRGLFIDEAHAAWIAQALFRLDDEEFDEDELLVAFFGDDYPAEAARILMRSRKMVEDDRAFRWTR